MYNINENLYHVFIDFTKALDRVWHEALWTTMRKSTPASHDSVKMICTTRVQNIVFMVLTSNNTVCIALSDALNWYGNDRHTSFCCMNLFYFFSKQSSSPIWIIWLHSYKTGPDSSVRRVSAPGNGRSSVRSRAATY